MNGSPFSPQGNSDQVAAEHVIIFLVLVVPAAILLAALINRIF